LILLNDLFLGGMALMAFDTPFPFVAPYMCLCGILFLTPFSLNGQRQTAPRRAGLLWPFLASCEQVADDESRAKQKMRLR
jgi:hypothetical protein